jgi:osmotically inducible protein OsmC
MKTYEDPLYCGAVVEGGRRGHGRTSDGRLDVDLSVPKEMDGDGGPGTNPEQLFALGYAACFQSALLGVARGRQRDVSASTITAHVGIGPTGHGGFGLTVALDLRAPDLGRADAEELMRRAHERCPYSNATRAISRSRSWSTVRCCSTRQRRRNTPQSSGW